MSNEEIVRVMTDAKLKCGFSQQYIADATGYSPSTVSRFFSGKMEGTDINFLTKLSELLNVSLTDVLDQSCLAAQEPPAALTQHDAVVGLLREMLATKDREHQEQVDKLDRIYAQQYESYERALIRRELFCYVTLGILVITFIAFLLYLVFTRVPV